MKDSKIAWTDATFNPWWGCSRVSPGCEHCYAEQFATVRHKLPVWGVDAERKPMSEAYWREPLKWNREAEKTGVRRRVFCASMADVFELLPERNVAGRAVQDAARARLWPLIEATPHLDWLLLTKRPENVSRLTPWFGAWPANIWLGVTAEDQRRADERIPILLSIQARVRFVSHEPALGAVRFPWRWCVRCHVEPSRHAETHLHCHDDGWVRQLDWIITGGESGPGARPYDLAWARQVVEHGAASGTAVFVKQLGADPIDGTAGCSVILRDRKGGDPSEWPAELRVQQWPAGPR